MNIEGRQPFRFSSPELHEMERRHGVTDSAYTLLRECPIGAIMREAPYVYDAINAASYAESGAFNPLESPNWLRRMMGVTNSERERLRKSEKAAAQGLADSKHGLRAR